MASRLNLDPQHIPYVQDAVARGLSDVGDDIVNDARAQIGSVSSTVARAVRRKVVRESPAGPTLTVEIGSDLGAIFEFSRQQPRRTRAGANRGVMRRREFFNKAVRNRIARGIDLNRYL